MFGHVELVVRSDSSDFNLSANINTKRTFISFITIFVIGSEENHTTWNSSCYAIITWSQQKKNLDSRWVVADSVIFVSRSQQFVRNEIRSTNGTVWNQVSTLRWTFTHWNGNLIIICNDFCPTSTNKNVIQTRLDAFCRVADDCHDFGIVLTSVSLEFTNVRHKECKVIWRSLRNAAHRIDGIVFIK